jgi:uncharacterized protein (TIGR02145 family)
MKMDRFIKHFFLMAIIAIFSNCTKTDEKPLSLDEANMKGTKPKPIYGQVTDVDGNVYRTLVIGDQTWMIDNLRTTKYRDGTPIEHVTNNSEWADLDFGSGICGAYCWYNNDISNKETYGALYNAFILYDGIPIAPEGWHIPTYEEWIELRDFLGGSTAAGGKMKTTGTDLWLAPNSAATNSSGFSGVPGGIRLADGVYDKLNEKAMFWSLGTNWTHNNNFYLSYRDPLLVNYFSDMNHGMSIRCVKDRMPVVETASSHILQWDHILVTGNVVSDGGSNVYMRGVCWSTEPNPDLSDNFTTDGTGLGEFVSSVEDLPEGYLFYIRTYAMNEFGTSYGEQIEFLTRFENPISLGDELYESLIVVHIFEFGDPKWQEGVQSGIMVPKDYNNYELQAYYEYYNDNYWIPPNIPTHLDIGKGLANTSWLASQNFVVYSHPAATFCDELELHGFDDYFLPTRDELQAIIDNINEIGWSLIFGDRNTSSSWSSSQYHLTAAYFAEFSRYQGSSKTAL